MSTTAITRLPIVRRSPATLQYVDYRHKDPHPEKPYFKPRFTFKSEDRKQTFGRLDFRFTDPLMPSYPYGKNHAFQEANFGLYGGTVLQSGNKISKGRNKGKTLRKWFPNVRVETFKSETLDADFKLPVTARVLRTIRKCGGLDNYVLGTKPARIKELGLLGWKLRWLVMTSPKMLAKHEQERRELGLPESNSLRAAFEDSWNDEEKRAQLVAQQESAWEDLRDAASRFENHVLKNWVENGEKEPYNIPKLETLQRTGPSLLGLPEHLERVQLGAGRETAKGGSEESEVARRQTRVGDQTIRIAQARLRKLQGKGATGSEPKRQKVRTLRRKDATIA
ncbi:hypothetical protein EDD37DRAFT_650474 [Exophiala viscosa]|uniref:Ribosomal protein L28 n=1 Tax=Exophiala viscosa TaxID=2486360 RepID=A0AAN6DUT5_9EURO|nr:hypothetical protein EDD36DRAFT_466691 [Exophiala viscosa]KAI1623376.1 hypothetical protein EDD37DRAFT_650474 [Exophiala viscosa]